MEKPPYKDTSAQGTEQLHLPSIPLPIDAEYIKALRRKWIHYFWSLAKTPTEIKLAEERSSRANEMVSSNQKKTLVSPKPLRPLTALYSSPRTTTRMKKVEQKMQNRSKSRSQSPQELNFKFCPECGFVNCTLSHKEHAEKMRQRLKKLLIQHPSLNPKKETIR